MLIIYYLQNKFNCDIALKIYNYYISKKYFISPLNIKAINLFHNYFINNNEIIEYIAKNFNYSNLMLLNKILINKNIIMIFTKYDGYILRLLPEQYKNDKDIVLNCVKKSFNSFKYAYLNELKDNYDFAKIIIEIDIINYYYLSYRLKTNINIKNYILNNEKHKYMLEYIP